MSSEQLAALVLRSLAFSAFAALAFVPLEHLRPLRPRDGGAARPRPGLYADLAFATAGQIAARLGIALGAGTLLASLDAFALERPLFAAVRAPLRPVLDVAVGLLLFELAGYAYHRLAHRVPLLWRLHALHHSSQTLDWLAAFRQHPLEIVLMTLVQNAPLVLLGVPLGAHAWVLLLLKLNTVFVHANVRVPQGLVAELLATPAFHHRHHDERREARNYASLFPFLDRVFGTYEGCR